MFPLGKGVHAGIGVQGFEPPEIGHDLIRGEKPVPAALQEIPRELYVAVAHVLAFAWSVAGKK